MPNVPSVCDSILSQHAERFLERYYPGGDVPVPIEEIVDLQLEMNIEPLLALKARFKIDGFLSCDGKTIFVDENVYRSHPNRLRFTLAHEAGHKIMHGDIINIIRADTPEEWKERIKSIPSPQYWDLEEQAHRFAAYVLVPKVPLRQAWCDTLKIVESQGLNLCELGIAGVEQLMDMLARYFRVSKDVIQRCCKRDRLYTA